MFLFFVTVFFGFTMSARTQFFLTAVFVVTALAALVVGLTLGLQTPGIPGGGSPTLPPELLTTAQPEEDTTEGSGGYIQDESGIKLGFIPHMAKDVLEHLAVPGRVVN